MSERREELKIVIIGHVDHGKSTLVGRLLADTNSLPEGKLESVKAYCEKNAKTFEYAFLLDALKEEQSQGITIDAARCFFKTTKRDYLIIDAPGHFEFIKNMVTGASRADAAIIVVDAKEGIRENTKRHGYLLSMLGLDNVCVVVNKMDLVGYKKEIFDNIYSEYYSFLESIGIKNVDFIPVSAKNGENVVIKSENLKWYNGNTVLEEIESWKVVDNREYLPFRFFVQDVYKFTSGNDERRILAGTIDYGRIRKGDKVTFYPSQKSSFIKSIEFFPSEIEESRAGESVGFTITDPFYISSGELMVKSEDALKPFASRKFLANIFWMGLGPLLMGKPYQAKIGTQKANVKIVNIEKVIDAVDPQNVYKKNKLDRYDIGVCEVETLKPVAFDTIENLKSTSRFVLIDQYTISGCGIILKNLTDTSLSIEKEIERREKLWERGYITKENREEKYRHRGKFILIIGENVEKTTEIAKILEKRLFNSNKKVYFLSINSLLAGLDRDITFNEEIDREEELRRLGEIAHILTDAGLIFISALGSIDKYEFELLKLLNTPYEILTVGSSKTDINLDFCYDENEEIESVVDKIIAVLIDKDIIEYFI
jgi:bifunctional enzyme CysN/CysC